MKQVLWALQAAIFYLFTLIIAMIPARRTHCAGRLTGLLMLRLLPGRYRIAVDNIRQALPFMKAHPLWNSPSESAEELARETFINLGHSLTEVCRLYHGKGEEVINSIELRGRENYEAARAKGNGLIFLTGHCGNWELVALAFSSLFGEGMSVVARRQNNPYLNRMVERMRLRYKSTVLYKQGALKGILSALKKGHLIGLLADQAAFPSDGALINVMGRKAWAYKAPVIIAQKSGAPMLPTFIHREGNRQVITFHPEHHFSGDMSEQGIQWETQALAHYVEDFVVAHPTQWYWVHRRWKRAGEAVE
jgi:Kdo2-lipid IVA lauroyltransferase/acyltransferase